MKIIFTFGILIFLVGSINAQDLIVTGDGDSINCRITKVKKDNIYFIFKYNNEIRSTLLPVSNVKTHQLDYYQISEVPKGRVVGYENHKRFRIAVNGGYSYIPAKISENTPSDFIDYTKELKSGYHWGFDATYYITEPLGVGFKYFVFKSKNSLDNIYAEDPYGNRRYGKMSDDISISFIGPTFSTRLLNSDKTNALIFGLAIGYVGYSNNYVLIDNFEMKGSTAGFVFEIGYDIGLSENVALGFQISSVSGSLIEYKFSDGSTTETIKLERDDELISTGHIDFSVGLRINL